MTEQQHPITPPPELVEQWYRDSPEDDEQCYIATQAARWGADRRLEAVCEYIAEEGKWFATPQFRLAELRAAMDPKPPSLKEQALVVLDDLRSIDATHYNILRNALEQLND